MRIENQHFTGFTMEERETEKFSRLAKLAQSLDILIFLIIQTTDGAPDRPIGSKKGAHEASVMIRLKREKSKEGDEHKERRKYVVHKNKISGQHFEKDIILNPFTLKFTRPYGEGGNEVKYTGHVPVEHKDASGKTTGQSAMDIIEGQLKEVAGKSSGQVSMPMI
jgi:RecA/RadA recombinase